MNTSSTAALGGTPYSVVYAASKGGVSALTRSIAVEYAKKSIRCNAIVPGQVDTNMTVDVALPENLDFSIMGRQAPVNGMTATPDMLASVIAMVASDDGAYMNGSEIRADGGGLS